MQLRWTSKMLKLGRQEDVFTGSSLVYCYSICLTPLKVSAWPWFIFTNRCVVMLLKIQDLKVQCFSLHWFPYPFPVPTPETTPSPAPSHHFFSLDTLPPTKELGVEFISFLPPSVRIYPATRSSEFLVFVLVWVWAIWSSSILSAHPSLLLPYTGLYFTG